MPKTIIGVMGPGEGASDEDVAAARELGRRIAEHGWVLLSGGRNAGVMDAVNKGAKEAGGLTVGVLPGGDRGNMSSAVDIPICTAVGFGRNNINVLSSDVVIACGVGLGTISEIALALKQKGNVILLNAPVETIQFFDSLDGRKPVAVQSVEQAIGAAVELLERNS